MSGDQEGQSYRHEQYTLPRVRGELHVVMWKISMGRAVMNFLDSLHDLQCFVSLIHLKRSGYCMYHEV